MAIDIRANVTCSLGTLISGSISDDYLQGSGLVKTRGSAEISALITPDVGTIVTFSYTKGGVTRSIPRKLRVLSSFADPFRRTTKVELGCKLTYLSDLREAIDWGAVNDPENKDYTDEDKRLIPLRIHAASVMRKCLAKLSIVASSIPLTNGFVIDKFDFSSGYVQVLSDLLVSESFFGYLDTNEILQIKSLNQEAGTGRVYETSDIIDIGPINVGQLPGEAVTVRYDALKLAAGELATEDQTPIEPAAEEEIEKINWESVSSAGTPQTYYINYKRASDDTDEQLTQQYSGNNSSYSRTTYKTIKIQKKTQQQLQEEYLSYTAGGDVTDIPTDERAAFYAAYDADPVQALDTYFPSVEPYQYVSVSTTRWARTNGWEEIPVAASQDVNLEEKEVVESRSTQETGPLVSIASSIGVDYLTYGLEFPGDAQVILSETYETFTYDSLGNQIGSVLETQSNSASVAAGLSAAWADENDSISMPTGLTLTQKTITKNKVFNDYTQDVVSTYIHYAQSQEGQQGIAAAVQSASGLADMQYIVDQTLASGLVHQNTQVTVSRKGIAAAQERPPAATRLKARYAKAEGNQDENQTDPQTAPNLSRSSQLVLALGSAQATRRIELSLPYAPDDYILGPSGGPYYQYSGGAQQKARLFGSIQNRLLLGNRNGMSLQVAPEKLPEAPFDPIYVKANGLTAHYRVNGTQWAFSSDGIVCSTDALFWAAVGGTGTFWFPVAPGVTTLPAEPAIVDGQMTPPAVVKPFNETALYDAVVRTRLVVEKFEYALELLTEIPALVVKVQADVRKITKVEVPAAGVTVAAVVPVVSSGASAQVPAAAMTLAAVAPAVSSAAVAVPGVTLTLEALVPESIGRIKTVVEVPSFDLTLSVAAPAVSSGTSLAVPTKDITVAGLVPLRVGGVPTVKGSFINSDATADTSHVLTVPTHVSGDLLVAVLMWRLPESSITAPVGWTLHTGDLLSSIVASGAEQNLHVYTRTASGSEPASYTWSATSSVRNAGLMVSVRNGAIDAITENYGNGTTATIATSADRLNLTVFTWIYASDSSETYSQSASAGTLTQITDSPKARGRLSGGYISSAATVTSTHSATTTADNPNHGGICISID